MKQSDWRPNGKINLFPELPPGLSIVYRVNRNPKKGKIERRLTLRIYHGHENRLTMHMNRDNYRERYVEAVARLVKLNALSRAQADRYDGMVSWDEIMKRFGLYEKQTIVYELSEPDDWVDPQLNRMGYQSQHTPKKRRPEK